MPEEHSQNSPPFKWNAKRVAAAEALAEDERTDTEIAAGLGVDRKTLWLWKTRPEFRARVEEIAAKLGDLATRHAVGRRARRLAWLDERAEKMRRVLEQRAADPQFEGVAGGDTGLMVHTVKGVGKGGDFKLIDLYEVDTGLLKEMREHEKQAAQELGQWVAKGEVQVGGEAFKVYLGFRPEEAVSSPPGSEPTSPGAPPSP